MLLAAQGAYAQTWVAGPNLPNGPRTYPAVAAIGNHVYVATGWRGNPPGPLNVLEMYDASTGQWTTGLPAVPTPRNTAAAGSLDGKLYVVGGGDGSGSVDTVEIFDPTAAPGQEWSIGPSMPTARNAPAAAVIDGKLYLIGGSGDGDGEYLGTLEVFDPSAPSGEEWTIATPMPTPRMQAGAAAIDGKLYVVGGGNASSARLDVLEIYDPAARLGDEWSTGPPMPTARSHPAVSAIRGMLCVAGGITGSTAQSSTVFYDPAAGRWLSGPTMTHARYAAGAAVVGGKVCIIGGANGGYLNSMETLEPSVVGGAVTIDTWKPGLSPYHVTAAVTVPSNNTLKVEPGVDVLFDADVQFIVNGALHAVGTAADSIRFIKGTAAEWGGILMSGGDSSTIAFAVLSGANSHGTGSEEEGGALLVTGSGSRVRMDDVVVTRNRANGGGGMSVTAGASAIMSDCIISDNSATWGGGMRVLYGGSHVSLTRCVIRGNSTSNNAGGISVYSSATAILTNCVVANNSCPNHGGGITINDAKAIIVNCTMTGNSGYRGIFVDHTGEVYIKNSILWGNSKPEVGDDGTAVITVASSDIEDGEILAGNIDADPLFVDGVHGDYHLSAGSPCIGAGAGGVDMGAFPYGPPLALVVRDVPNDQGGSVILEWTAAAGDTDMSTMPRYSVWRALPADAARDAGGVYRVARSGTAEHVWGWLADHPARKLPSYYYVAETLYDSMSITDGMHDFMVTAHTNDPNTFTDSNIAGGYSVDNLAPSAPGSPKLVANRVVWSPAPESGVKHYVVYQAHLRSIGFGDVPYLTTVDTSFAVEWNRIYGIAAVDFGGNEGELATIVAVIDGVGGEVPLPTQLALSQNAPNPFNPSTTIRFAVPEAAAVELAVYSTSGQLVRTLVGETVDAGHHVIVWDGRDLAGREVASGVYLYRLKSRSASIVRRMLLVR